MKNTINQFGTSLFEIICVLAIASVLTFGVISLYTAASSRAKVAASTYELKKEAADAMVFGPYKAAQVFQKNENGFNIFLGDACKDNFSCKRSFCGEIEVKNKEEVYIHIKNLSHCITKLAKY